MKTIYYDPNTGRVTKWAELNGLPAEWNLSEGESFLEVDFGEDPHNYYVADGALVHRQVMEVEIDGHVIRDIPPGSEAIVDEFGAVIVDDGELELDANFSGPVYIVVNHPHYKTEALTVTL